MDGGGRLLGSLGGAALALFGGARPRIAGWPADYPAPRALRPLNRRERRVKRRASIIKAWNRRGTLGFCLTLLLFSATGLYGTVRNGQYAAFVAEYGSPADIVAKAIGFPIRAIAISGARVMEPAEILKDAGIGPTQSLLLLNDADVRARLMGVPLVREAVVTKLFPNRLAVTIEEREPVALWQKDGQLAIVSGDGVVIDGVRDDRFAHLPFVVGDGANTKVAEFLTLLDQAGDLRPRIVAGIRVSDRRWDLKMDNGLRVALPEDAPGAAVAAFAAYDKQARLMDKDLVSVDLRMPGRIAVRLSDDAAAARATALAKKPKAKGTQE